MQRSSAKGLVTLAVVFIIVDGQCIVAVLLSSRLLGICFFLFVFFLYIVPQLASSCRSDYVALQILSSPFGDALSMPLQYLVSLLAAWYAR